MDNSSKLILHLCADIGSDSQIYRDNEYTVKLVGADIGVENYHHPKNETVYGIIANPPCTQFSIARTIAKTPRNLYEGLFLVNSCIRIIHEIICNQYDQSKRSMPLKFWYIENPYTGFLKWFLGKPSYIFSPDEFGDDYTKKTALWGIFNEPIKPFFKRQLESSGNIKFKIPIYKIRNDYDRMNVIMIFEN
jgi:hypothetical protein